jgi:hypothetical protein
MSPLSSSAGRMARKTVIVCDNCQRWVDPGVVVRLRLTYSPGRGVARVAELCESCAGALPGQASRTVTLSRSVGG